MKFLILKTSSVGDIIQTFPVIEYLKHRYPTCQIDWMVEEEYAPLVQSHPDIARVHVLATRRWRRALFNKKHLQELAHMISSLKKTVYDVVFDLQGNTKSACFTYLAKATKKVGFGWRSSPEWPNYFATRERFDVDPYLPIQKRYLSIVQQFYTDPEPFTPRGVILQLSPPEQEQLIAYRRDGQKRIMVAFASKWNNKCLSMPLLTQFLQQVYEQENCYFYFVSGSDQEKKIADQLAELFPKSQALQGLTFPLWQRLMGEMDLVIAVDSAALALCGTISTPSFSFFGPTQASVYKPLGQQHTHFQGTCPYNIKFAARCPQLRSCKTGACLKMIELTEIFRDYLSQLVQK